MTPGLFFTPQTEHTLRALDQKRKLIGMKGLLWLAVPVLWVFSVVLLLFDNTALNIIAGVWIFVVLFGVGIYIHVVLPSKEELAKQFKKTTMPELLRLANIDGDYSAGHGLSVESFLRAGLYRENYSHFVRADCIIGKTGQVKFGLYELAVQAASGHQGFAPGVPSTHLLTNLFYGWVLHVPVRRLAGNTYIIPVSRRTKHESDDWLNSAAEHFRKSNTMHFVQTHDPAFDATFYVFTSDPGEALVLLQPDFRTFLLKTSGYLPNAAAYSFCESRAAMHAGISGSCFDPEGGRELYPGEVTRVLELLLFFSSTVSALQAAASAKK